MSKNVFIATSTFGQVDKASLRILKKNKITFSLNPLKRKLTDEELIKFGKKFSIIIAGTENYNSNTLSKLKRLKLIFRLGSGLDNIDLEYCRRNKIKIMHSKITPEKAVAELVVGMILSLLRNLNNHHNLLKKRIWKKQMGSLLCNKKIGIIGYGKIGKYLNKILKYLGAKVLINDIKKTKSFKNYSLKQLFSKSDIISIHINNSNKNKNLINTKLLKLLKKNAILINTSRPEVLDYKYLFSLLNKKKIFGAGLDVFPKEPYSGSFQKLNNVILTPHIGSYAKEIRSEMEIEASNKISKF